MNDLARLADLFLGRSSIPCYNISYPRTLNFRGEINMKIVSLIFCCVVLAASFSTGLSQVEPASGEPSLNDLFTQAKSLIGNAKPNEALAVLREAEKLAPKQYEIQMLLGIVFAEMKQYPESVSAFQKAADIQPRNAGARSNLCKALGKAGKRMEAVDECREAVRLDPDNEKFQSQLADLYLLNERGAEALSLLEAAYIRFQNSIKIMGQLADVYYDRSEYGKALELYEKIASLDPTIDTVHFRLSLTYDHLDRPDDAITAAKKYLSMRPADLAFANLHLGRMLQNGGFFDESLEPLKKAAELKPKLGAAYLEMSVSYEAIGDKENTLLNLRKAYNMSPPNLSLSRRLGWALTNYGAMAEAVEPLERANDLRPNDPYIMTKLGLAYFESNSFDKAIDILQRADVLLPNDRVITMFLGVARSRRATLLNFDDVFEKARNDPKDAEARTLLGMAYRYRGMPREAEAEHLNSIRLDPKNAKRYKQLAIFYLDTGQIEKALEYSVKSADIDPNHVYLWSVGSVLRRLGRLDEAIAATKRSIAAKPSFVEARIELGELYEKKGDRTAALQEYQSAFDLASGDERPNFKLAWAYIRMGNKEGAIRHYNILKGMTPDNTKYLAESIKAHFGRSSLSPR